MRDCCRPVGFEPLPAPCGVIRPHTGVTVDMLKARFATVYLLILASMLGMSPARAITVTSVQDVGILTDMSLCGFSGAMQLADGSRLKVRLTLSDAEKKLGLSGLRKTEFAGDEALLMVNFNNNQRSVNMGDTHFNLDVFFLDNDLRVVGLHRNLKAHPGKTEPPAIENSPWVYARHIMEMRADSRYASQIQVGTVLRWQSEPGVKEIERCMAGVWRRSKGYR